MMCENCKVEMNEYHNAEANLYVCLNCGLYITKMYLDDDELETFKN